MPLHIIKLCVGCDSLAELADWQKKRLKEKRAKGQKPELIHITRMTPKRADEVLAGRLALLGDQGPDRGAPETAGLPRGQEERHPPLRPGL